MSVLIIALVTPSMTMKTQPIRLTTVSTLLRATGRKPLLAGRTVTAALFALVWVVTAGASTPVGIEILSASYQLTGSWVARDWLGGYLGEGSYSYASTGEPITANHSGPSVNAGIDTFLLYNDSSVGSDSLGTYAKGDWRFRTLDAKLLLGLEVRYWYNYYSWEQDFSVKLIDETSGDQMLNLTGQGSQIWIGNRYEYAFPVDPSHIYDFSIEAWSSNYSHKWVQEHITATLIVTSPAPDQASCAWLLATTLSALLVLRRSLNSQRPL